MSVSNPYQQYKQTQIGTASPGALIIMLYDAALRNLRTAHLNIENRNPEGAHFALLKVEDIILELNLNLNMEAGKIAQDLRDLYEYINQRLVEANLHKDLTIIKEIENLVTELKEGWEGVIRTAKTGGGTDVGG